MQTTQTTHLSKFGIQNYKKPKLNKRKAILDESFSMIQKEGLSNFSMKRLCKKLDMAQSGIFYYFNNVNFLFAELVKKQIFDETNFLLAQVQLTKKPKRAVKRYFFYFIEYYLNRPELFKLVYLNPAYSDFDEVTKKALIEDQQTILVYLEHICEEILFDKTRFGISVKSLKLQAQSLVSYYYLQASQEEKANFEMLCKECWKNFSTVSFKDY